MFIPSIQGAAASTDSVANSPTSTSAENSPAVKSTTTDAYSPPPNGPDNSEPSYHETVRHMLFGPPLAVGYTIRLLHKRGYAEPNDWSKPISTGKPDEVMAILTKRIRL